MAAVERLTFPADLPVLTFLAQDNIDHLPVWLPAHQQQLEGRAHGQLVVIDDSHYLHHHHAPQIAAEVRTFLAASAGLAGRARDAVLTGGAPGTDRVAPAGATAAAPVADRRPRATT